MFLFNKNKLLFSSLWIVLPALIIRPEAAIGNRDSLKLNTDLLYLQGKQLCQDVYLTAPEAFKAKITINCYQFFQNGDSTLVYSKESAPLQIHKGVSKTVIVLNGTKGGFYALPGFSGIVEQYDLVPPGNYKLFLSLRYDSIAVTGCFIRQRDSILPAGTPVRETLTEVISGRKLHKLSGFLTGSNDQALPDDEEASKAFLNAHYRIVRFSKRKGLDSRQYIKGDSIVIDFYKGAFFVGRYAMKKDARVRKQIKKARDALDGDIGDLADNQLGHYQPLATQFRKMKKHSKDNAEMNGEIALSANLSNDREAFSTSPNNYYEARGTFEFPVFDIPVQIDGYYTTEDKGRPAKSSYIHFRYDAEKAKEQLMKLIGSYNKRYEETLARGGNYQMIYGQFIGQLEQQKDKAIGALKQEAGITAFDPGSFDAEALKGRAMSLLDKERSKLEDSLKGEAVSAADSQGVSAAIAKVEKAKAAAAERYRKVMKRYEEVKTLEGKITHYRKLLDQYKTTLYYDSALAFKQLQNLRGLDQMPYKDIAKKASGILPERKTKSFITGLTHFDAGMFPAYLSDYTMSGQMMQGLSAGYDIGFAVAGASYGKTQYMDASGNVEDYKSYSGSIVLKPVLNQSFGFIYYGYSPSARFLGQNDFFKSTDISLPSFRNPVHILSATYTGEITKYLGLKGEYAFSSQQGQSEEAARSQTFKDRSSYNIHLTGNIPYTSISLDGGYEHAGSGFENNTLPVLMSGTEQVTVSGRGDFFRSFLTLGISYDYLLQNSFYTTGHNSRWGFEVSTHSKRYPSVYLSYKPFSTFRSFNDTLNIPQKPMLGEVWTGRASYQVKKPGRSLRFSLLYNQNSSIMDTLRYGSTLMQASIIYMEGTLMLALDGGISKVNEADYAKGNYPAYNNNEFADLSAGFPLTDRLNMSGGLNAARCAQGWIRYGFTAGSVYAFKKTPLMLRLNFRYNRYRPEVTAGWKGLYNGTVELLWRFKLKLSDKPV